MSSMQPDEETRRIAYRNAPAWAIEAGWENPDRPAAAPTETGPVLDAEALAEARGEIGAIIAIVEDGADMLDEIMSGPVAALVAAARADEREREGGISLIAAERRRQVEAEGWTADHDDQHERGELADAAALYIARAQYGQHGDWLSHWRTPAQRWIKDFDSRQRQLVKAGALIAAELDRIARGVS